MEPIFTLPYPEFAVANELQKYFKPKKGYSVLIPLSRQQKGFDLILYSKKSDKVITFQIKNSRAWTKKPPKREGVKPRLQVYSWFNKFEHELRLADYYVLFMPYPKNIKYMGKLNHTKKIKKWYDFKLLIFDDKEMRKFLSNLKDKRFFGFGFNYNSKEILLTRGLKNKYPSYRKNLMEYKLTKIIKILK